MMTYSVAYTRENIQDVSHYGYDVEKELTRQLSNEIAKEMDSIILQSLGIDTFDQKLEKIIEKFKDE